METRLENPVRYDLQIGNDLIHFNPLIGTYIVLRHDGLKNCIVCARQTNKTFFQGLCYPCYLNAPEASECILRPELCEAHQGNARDMDWATGHCLQDHYVYLALTSNLKVGVTRQSQVPTRWIDQGAWKTIRLAKTPNRFIAGCIEVSLKNHISDKTFWQRMLKNELDTSVDLIQKKEELGKLLEPDLRSYICEDDAITEITYPVTAYPEKVKSASFDKSDEIAGVLYGIKGQYLLFDDGRVLNIRKFQGYQIDLEY